MSVDVDDEVVDLQIEAVTKMRSAADPYTSSEPKTHGGGARLVRISLPRVRWLERPEIEVEVNTPNK